MIRPAGGPSERRTVFSRRDAGPTQASRSLRGTAGRALILGSAAALLSGCDSGILSPAGPIGEAERLLLFNALAIMLAIIVPTIIATLAFAWWFRASNTKATYLPDWEFSGRIEIVVWSIPLLVILFLGGIAWTSSHDLDPFKTSVEDTKALEVQVVSLDWKWLFIYPEQGVASVNELVVPTHTPLHFTLTSASVMNAFFVPQLGSMIYTMNGMATQLHLEASREGSFEGLSAHFSGDGFSDMHFLTKAVGQDAFFQWVEGARGSAATLGPDSYRDLAKQSTNVPPATYKLTGTGLFTDIVMQTLPPGPGPAPSVSPKTGGE